MSVRYRIAHKEAPGGTQVSYRVDIDDSEFNGAVTQKVTTGDFFNWEYDQIDERDPFEKPVQKSAFDVFLRIEDDDDFAFISDILDADQNRFQINFYINTVLQWSGKVLNDLLEYPEAGYPYTAKITAKDLSALSGIDAPEADLTAFRRVSVLIADCLNQTSLSLPLRSYTNLTHADATQANDFLHEIYHMREAMQEMSCMEALENICRAYNLIIRQAGARWIIDQLPAVAKDDDVQFDYDADGLNPVSSSPDRIQTVDGSDSYILPTSVNIVTGALKRIESVYNHRTLIHDIETEDVTYEFNPVPNYETFTLEFDNEPGYRLYFSTEVEVDADTTSGIEGSAYITVRGVAAFGSDQYLTDAGKWSSVQQDIEITMSGSGGSMSGSFEAADAGSIADTIEEIIITPRWADASHLGGDAQTITEVRWRNTLSYIFHGSLQDTNASIRSRYTRTGNYHVSEDVGETVLGDGPTHGTNTASKGRPANGSLASTVLEPGRYKLRGASEQVSLEEITLRERVNMRRDALRNLRADMWVNYSPEKIISYRSKRWFFLGGYFSAKRSRWNANIIELSYTGNTIGDQFSATTEAGGSAGAERAGSGRSEPQSGALYANAVGYITGELDGTYTDVPAHLYIQVRKGIDYNIIHELGREKIPITPTANAGPGNTSIQIEEQVIEVYEGSFILKAPAQEETESQDTYKELTDLNENKLPLLEQKIDEIEQVDITEIEDQLDNLNDNVIPALQNNLDNLNNTVIPAIDSNLDNLNNTVIPGIDASIDDLNNNQIPALESNLGHLETVLGDPPDRATFITMLVAESIFANELVANTVFVNALTASSVFVNELIANVAFIESLAARNLFANDLVANTTFTNTLATNTVFTDDLVANTAFVNTLAALQVFADEIVANTAFLNELAAKNVFTDALAANTVFTNELVSKTAFVNELIANQVFTDTLASNTVFTNELVANSAFVNELTANTAFIDDIFASTATVAGPLTLGTGGKLRTAADETVFDEDGLTFDLPGSFANGSSLVWATGTDSAHIGGYYSGADPLLEYEARQHSFKDHTGDLMLVMNPTQFTITSVGSVHIDPTSLPNSDPSVAGQLWRRNDANGGFEMRISAG